MKTRLATLLAAALAFAVAGTSSPHVTAAPLHVSVPALPAPATLDITKAQAVGGEFRRGGRNYRGGHRSGRHIRGGGRYYRGGRHHYRPRAHYRHRHRGGDFVAPLVGGLIIGGIIANQAPRRYYRHGNAHVNWCYNRYRSYDARSDTFQPYRGPRRKCHSPYG
jgi:hypothetical protein